MPEDQRAINMHTSQISHGYFILLPGEDNEVITGYTPSMIRLFLLSASGILSRAYWYSTTPAQMYVTVSDTEIGDSIEESIVTVTERGFVLDGTADILTAQGDLGAATVKVFWETFGADPGKGT